MRILAIQTSTPTGSVAISEGNEILFHQEWRRPKGRPRKGEKFLSHSEMVGQAVENGLKELRLEISAIDQFVTSVGPGSFTGIRVGLAAAKSFGFSLNKPVYGYDSLLVLAQRGRSQDLPVLSLLNAYNNQVYAGSFQIENGEVKTIWSPKVLNISDLNSELTETSYLCLGDGLNAYPKTFSDLKQLTSPQNETWNDPCAKDLVHLHVQQFDKSLESPWSNVNPLYLKGSEAEEKLQSGLLKPIKQL